MNPIFISTTVSGGNSDYTNTLLNFKQIGINKIEIGSTHNPISIENAVEVSRNFKNQYLLHNFFPPLNREIIINPASKEESDLFQTKNQINLSIDFAKKIDVQLITIHPGFLSKMIENKYKNSNNLDFKRIGKFISKEEAIKGMKKFFEEICSKNKNQHFAIENSGSFTSKENIFFDKPSVIANYLSNSPSNLGLNLNIAHLYLSSLVHKFDMNKALKLLSKYTVAIEVSHFEDIYDSHKPLKEESPVLNYLKYLLSSIQKEVPIILELRPSSNYELLNSLKILEKIQTV